MRDEACQSFRDGTAGGRCVGVDSVPPSPIIHCPNPATLGTFHQASPTGRWHEVDGPFEQTTAHKWRPSETRDTTARASRGNLETSDTFARPQCRTNTHFERAKVMAVSPTHKDRATKATAVSAWQRIAPKRQAMRQARCGRDTCAVTTGPDRAPRRRANQRPGPTGVEGAGGTEGHGRASRRGAERSEVA